MSPYSCECSCLQPDDAVTCIEIPDGRREPYFPSKSPDHYNILSHYIPQEDTTEKQKALKPRKSSTTYRDHYCRKRFGQKTEKAIPPRSAILFIDEKFSGLSSYKDSFHKFSSKECFENKGKIVVPKDSLTCSGDKFESKSESKAAFVKPTTKIIKVSGDNSALLSSIKPESFFSGSKEFSSATTYKSTFKRPKNFSKTEGIVPKNSFTISTSKPFSYISQYMSDYGKRIKRLSSKRHSQIPGYRRPTVFMERDTTYNTNFMAKEIPRKKKIAWNPQHPIYRNPINWRLMERHNRPSCKPAKENCIKLCRDISKESSPIDPISTCICTK